jgi:hypothetical protein
MNPLPGQKIRAVDRGDWDEAIVNIVDWDNRTGLFRGGGDGGR